MTSKESSGSEICRDIIQIESLFVLAHMFQYFHCFNFINFS